MPDSVRRLSFTGLAVLLAVISPILGSRASGQVPDFPHGTFPEGVECLDCHTTEGWSPIREDPAFDHGDVTGFPLLGRHGSASCRACHDDLHFERAEAGVLRNQFLFAPLRLRQDHHRG